MQTVVSSLARVLLVAPLLFSAACSDSGGSGDICPAGTVSDGAGGCAPDDQCPAGAVRQDDGSCDCGPGFEDNGAGMCRLIGTCPPTATEGPDGTCMCPDGFTLELERCAINPGGDCDVSSPTPCVSGSFCFTGSEDESLGSCRVAEPPVIAEAVVTWTTAGWFFVRINGSDPSADVIGFDVSLFEGDTAIPLDRENVMTRGSLSFEPSVFGQESFVGRQSFLHFDALRFANVDRVQLWLRDSTLLTSAPVEVPFLLKPELERGEACDPFGIENSCVEGSACVEEGGSASCTAAFRPEITELKAWFSAAETSFAVDITGNDGDQDVEAFVLTLVDADGNPVNDDDWPPLFPLRQPEALDEVRYEGDVFHARAGGRLGIMPEGFQIGVVMVDALGQEGARVLATPVAPEAAAEDAPCDLRFARTECADGLACYQVPGTDAGPVCTTPVEGCPDDWEVVDLTALRGDEGWRFEGSSVGAADRAQPWCAPGGAGLIFSFVAPAEGLYRFTSEAEDPEADTIMWVREHCGHAESRFQLDCIDDSSPDSRLATIDFRMGAEQQLYIFVDGYFSFLDAEGWTGQLGLSVTGPHADDAQ